MGTGRSLSLAELRWCRYQSQRIEGARSAVQGKSDAAVSRFNSLVEDYNGRCGEFRYLKRDLDKVDAEVAAKATSLRSEGVALVAPPRPAPKKGSPSQERSSVQGSGSTFACKDANGNWIFGTVGQERCVGPIKTGELRTTWVRNPLRARRRRPLQR